MDIPITLRTLFSFQPINDREKEVFKFDEKKVSEMKYKLDKNIFYLGGQIRHTEINNTTTSPQGDSGENEEED